MVSGFRFQVSGKAWCGSEGRFGVVLLFERVEMARAWGDVHGRWRGVIQW